ncbi:magnesium transporter, partial [Mycotypha africana]|uniref:magnesium transporter n=1 Tax=Mycotypha africana TaxID=64632 RepID=UPI0022FFD837
MGTEENVIRIAIGIFVSLGASFMDALGLNILKLDHVKESNKPERRSDCGRPLWHLGLYTYIASQLIGSTIALNFLKTQWVAPLGSVALIFNFLFAKLLVNTQITRKDVLGTCVVVASVVWIVVFGGIILNFVAFGGLILSLWSKWSLTDENRRQKSQLFSSMDQKKMAQMVGLMFSIEGGVLASETLLLAKSGVKLFTLSVQSQVNQFNDNASRFILLALLITAVLQVYCLNTALKLYTSVVVVPVFYGTYTALGLVNTIIYLDEFGNYPVWAIFLVFAGIGVLIYGVYLLSSKPEPNPESSPHLTTEEDL